MTRILHAADIHLDSPLENLAAYEGAPVDRIRLASRVALENLVDLAIERSVDVVLIAGDLYDGDWQHQSTGLFFVKQASRLTAAGIAVAIIRGNHDAWSKMTSHLRLPANPDGSNIMLDEKRVDTRVFETPERRIAVHGRSYRKQHERGDLVKHYPPPMSDAFNVGLLHTGLTGLDGHIAYAPCTPRQLADFEYDYWALGHIHVRGEHHVDGAAPVVFSGNIQGRHIRESGPKGCVLIDVDAAGGMRRTFEPLDVVRWERLKIDAARLDRPDDVVDAFAGWLPGALESVADRLLVPRVEVHGDTGLDHQLNRRVAELEGSLRSVAIDLGGDQVWLEKLKLRTRPATRRGPNRDANDASELGAIASIRAVTDDLLADPPSVGSESESPKTSGGDLFPDSDSLPTAADWVSDQLAELLAKLPRDLATEIVAATEPDPAAEAVLVLDDAASVRRAIESAGDELIRRLGESE